MKKRPKTTQKCSELVYGANVIFKCGNTIRRGFVTSVDLKEKTVHLLSYNASLNVKYEDMIAVYNSMARKLWEINSNEAKFPGDELIPE